MALQAYANCQGLSNKLWPSAAGSNHRLRRYLHIQTSLTAILEAHFGRIEVRVVQDHLRAFSGQPSIPIRRGQLARHRVVVLVAQVKGVETPLVYAESWFNQPLPRHRWRALARLGNRPLGAVLFADPKIRRSTLGYRKLSPHQRLSRAARHAAGTEDFPDWSRARVHGFATMRVWVTEVFFAAPFDGAVLPDIPVA